MNMTKESLENLATNRLLAIRDKLYKNLWEPDSALWSCMCDGCVEERDALKKHYDKIKLVNSILNSREHVEKRTRKRRALEPYIGECPRCGVKHGNKCKTWGKKKPKSFIHKERIDARSSKVYKETWT